MPGKKQELNPGHASTARTLQCNDAHRSDVTFTRCRPDAEPMLNEYVAQLLEARMQRPAQGRELDAVLQAGQHPYSRPRQYRVYLPAELDMTEPAPLVVMLHGCQQTHLDIQHIAGFDTIADREQCVVVYPYVTSYLGYRHRDCWGWWLKPHRTRGQGEVEDIWRIVEQVQQLCSIDATRIHVAGLSAGASMAVACLTAYSDRFASGASVAGLAYGESASAVSDIGLSRHKSPSRLLSLLNSGLHTELPPALLVIQSLSDTLVSPEAADGLEGSWRAVGGLGDPALSFEGISRSTSWWYNGYYDGCSQWLASLRVEGPEHGWTGGPAAPFSTPEGPAISELIWSHFAATPGISGIHKPHCLALAS